MAKTKYVTAKQLAEELLKHPNDIVCVRTDNFEQGQSNIPRRSSDVMRFKGEVVKQGFRDAFDGGSYESDIVSRNDKDGKLNFVKI